MLENRLWNDAATLKIHPANFLWQKFPWQRAIVNFTRLLGFVHTGKIDSAKTELKTLYALHDTLTGQKDAYKANQLEIQIAASEAWILFAEGKNDEALKTMTTAAENEDHAEKHPVTPCEVIPARELLADMLLQTNKTRLAQAAYEADLVRHPNRFNGLYGAGVCVQRLHDFRKAGSYYKQLITIANAPDSNRPELAKAKLFLKDHDL